MTIYQKRRIFDKNVAELVISVIVDKLTELNYWRQQFELVISLFVNKIKIPLAIEMRRYSQQSTSKNSSLPRTSPYISISASDHTPCGRRRPALWVGLPLCNLSITRHVVFWRWIVSAYGTAVWPIAWRCSKSNHFILVQSARKIISSCQ